MKEAWKDIPGYEGKYQASTFGRIRSLDRQIIQIGRGGKPFVRSMKGRVLRPGKYNRSGHLSVVLGRGTNGIQVHYLIALTFIGERPEGYDIRHLDGNPQNNRIENIKYGTRSENILDVYRQGNKWRNTSKEQAVEIKELLKNKELKCTEIANIVGVTDNVVYHISNGGAFSWLEC